MKFEDLIDFNLKARGWSKIAVANDVLVKFGDYVNSKYADNGNEVVILMKSYFQEIAKKED